MKLQLWETIERIRSNNTKVAHLKNKFQGQYEISQHLFKLDTDWIEEIS